MLGTIGQTLPLAIGIAISPFPIAGAIISLFSPKAPATGVGFLLGWLIGVAAVTIVFTLLATSFPGLGDDGSGNGNGTAQLVFGALLIVMAVRRWRKRPAAGDDVKTPGWMEKVSTMSPAGSLGLGLVLSAANPKVLLLAASAGVTFSAASLSTGQTALAIANFTVLCASTVLVIVVAYILRAEQMRGPLESLRVWLIRENSAILAVILLVIGAVVLGNGLQNF